MSADRPPLTDEERAIYEWQLWVHDFGEAGQEALKAATVMVSRIGGLGGMVAYQLAAAGVGRLVLAHAGDVKHSDLNRQLLMTHAALGTSRLDCAVARLRELNPRLDIVVELGAIFNHGIDVIILPELCSGCDKCLDPCPVDCIYPLPVDEWQPSPEDWWQEPLSANDPYV